MSGYLMAKDIKDRFGPLYKTEAVVDSVSSGTPDNVKAVGDRSSTFLGSGTKGNRQEGSSNVDVFYGSVGTNHMTGLDHGDIYLIDRIADATYIYENVTHRGNDIVLFEKDIKKEDLTFQRLDKQTLTVTIKNSNGWNDKTVTLRAQGNAELNQSWSGIEELRFANGQTSLSWQEIDAILAMPQKSEDDEILDILASDTEATTITQQAEQLTHVLAQQNTSVLSSSSAYIPTQANVSTYTLTTPAAMS
ncbi:MAG: hypothetical protein IT497_06135 [Ottowia sp.]|nr:hypothetical protein [Ottowia sp.]